jgi:hypothetical protein
VLPKYVSPQGAQKNAIMYRPGLTFGTRKSIDQTPSAPVAIEPRRTRWERLPTLAR